MMSGDRGPAEPYSSYLLRCWRRGGPEQRYQIQHVQSGAQVTVATLAEAMSWIAARDAGTPAAGNRAASGAPAP